MASRKKVFLIYVYRVHEGWRAPGAADRRRRRRRRFISFHRKKQGKKNFDLGVQVVVQCSRSSLDAWAPIARVYAPREKLFFSLSCRVVPLIKRQLCQGTPDINIEISRNVSARGEISGMSCWYKRWIILYMGRVDTHQPRYICDCPQGSSHLRPSFIALISAVTKILLRERYREEIA